MRILVEHSGYALINHGDTAMLQVAVQRVAQLWPDAYIEVITSDAALLKKYCPDAHPLLLTRLSRWHQIRRLADPQIDAIAGWVRMLEKQARQRFPRLRPQQLERKWKGYINAVDKADFVLAAGGGYINDTFLAHGAGVLETLQEAIQRGKPAVILGHGFEPIDNPALRAKAQAVLPKLNLVGCREKRYGPATLQSWGVSPNKIVVTGDDTVELGYKERAAELGNGLGVNLRVAWYAGVNKKLVEIVRGVLQNAARKHAAPLISLPIATRCPSDASYIEKLLEGYSDASNGERDLDNPLDVVRRTGHCRMVITGSYHAAVFALSQGIPAVCLSQTNYYVRKFQGLNSQFGDGCYVLAMDDADFRYKLADTIDQAWERAEKDRPHLLEAAEQQVKLGLEAYQMRSGRGAIIHWHLVFCAHTLLTFLKKSAVDADKRLAKNLATLGDVCRWVKKQCSRKFVDWLFLKFKHKAKPESIYRMLKI